MTDEMEVEIEVCCDDFKAAVEDGALPVVKMEPSGFGVVLPTADGETGVLVNFCPFCGQPRPHVELEEE